MTDVFSAVALFQWWGFKVGQGTGARQVSSMNVTPSFFQVLGAKAERGRLLSEEEGTPGRTRSWS